MTAASEIDLNRLTRDTRRLCIQSELCANHALARTGITVVQAHVLLYVLRHSPQGVFLTDLHRESGYSMAHLSATVKCLRGKGYVRVESCAGDDRRKLLFPTEQGERIRPFLLRTLRGVEKQLYACLSPAELRDWSRLQSKLLQNLSCLTTKAPGGTKP